MAKRSTIYNSGLTSKEDWECVSEENREILDDFLLYKKAGNKSLKTVSQYEAVLRVFFVWNMRHNKNKFFIDLKKRELIKFMHHMVADLKYSTNRIANIKSILSSLSNYVEDILDEEYPTFKNIVKSLETPTKEPVREKTVLDTETVEGTLQRLVEDKQYQIACYLALLTSSGMRKAEALRCQVSFFIDENIKFGCMWRTPPIKSKGRGAGGKMLNKFVFIKQFEPYLNLWLKEREKKNIVSDWLFVIKGEQAKVNNADNWVNKIKTYLPDFYSHSARHYWTTSLKKEGIPEDVIIELQGWSKTSGGAMVAIYNDMDIVDEFHKYFDENGIKKLEN